MTVTTPVPLAAQRALGAGTTQRFALLLILFLVSGVQLVSGLVWDPHFPGVHVHSDESYGCILAAGVNPSAAGIALYAPTIHEDAALNACVARYGWNPPSWPPYAITAGLAALTGLVYLLLASGRPRVTPVADVDPGGELAAALREVTATAGLTRPPRFVVDAAAITESAVAFGSPGWHTVCLHGGLVARFRSDPDGFRAIMLRELACFRDRDIGLIHVTIAAIAGLICLLPAARRRQVVPVADVDPGGELAAALRKLTTTAGLTRPPRFVVDPTATTASAVAFGLPGWHTVCLNGTLVARFRSDLDGFRTVVLHELAHIKNRDVGLTYTTIAAWRVYLIALLLPAAVSSAWLPLSTWMFGTNAQSVFRSPVQTSDFKSLAETAFVVLLVYLARADVMRTREAYADLDAATWGARTAALPDDGRRPGPLAAFWQLWRTHPSRREQVAVLTDTTAVFQVSSLQMFLTGAAAMVILYQFQGDLSPDGTVTGGSQNWPGILAAALIMSVVGVALWRAVANAALTGCPAPSGLRAGLWLGTGLVAGDLMEGRASAYHWLPDQPVFLLALPLFAIVATTWTAQFAALSVGTWHGRGRGLAAAAGLTVIWAAAATWLNWWSANGYLFALGFPLTSDTTVQILLAGLPGPVIPGHNGTLLAIAAVISLAGQQWLLAVAGALLWVAPLLTWARQMHTGSPRLQSVVLSGLGGAVVCWAAVIAVMAYLHSWRIPPDQRLGSYLLIFFGDLVGCVVVGMVAAAVAAALLRGFRLLAALMAAGTASLGGLAGAYLLVSVDGCVAPLDTLANSCAWRPALGWDWVRTFGALALAVGSAAAVAAALVVVAPIAVTAHRRVRSGAAAPDQAKPTLRARSGLRAWSGRLLARRTAIVALTAMAATVLAVTISAPGGGGSGTASSVATASQLTPPATYSASPQATGVMDAAWLHFGGFQLMTVLSDGFTRLSGAINQANAELNREENKQGLVSDSEFRTAEAPTVAVCTAMMRTARHAESYFPVPSPPLQLQWQSVLTGLSVNAQGCAGGVRKASTAELVASLNGMIRAGDTLDHLLTELLSVADHFCRACA